MGTVALGILCGLAFGAIDVLIMIPLQLEEKKTAMLGAFCNRFAIGFLIATAVLPLPPWAKGLLVGLLLSLPEAIITRAWAPILGVGIAGGIVIGVIAG